jgi:hypothetical protein
MRKAHHTTAHAADGCIGAADFEQKGAGKSRGIGRAGCCKGEHSKVKATACTGDLCLGGKGDVTPTQLAPLIEPRSNSHMIFTDLFPSEGILLLNHSDIVRNNLGAVKREVPESCL